MFFSHVFGFGHLLKQSPTSLWPQHDHINTKLFEILLLLSILPMSCICIDQCQVQRNCLKFCCCYQYYQCLAFALINVKYKGCSHSKVIHKVILTLGLTHPHFLVIHKVPQNEDHFSKLRMNSQSGFFSNHTLVY